MGFVFYNEIYAKEKKMCVKRMVEVKNTYKIMGLDRSVKEKKMGYERWMVKVSVKNCAYWTNGRFD